MKTIGMIGGMSWESTLHYYQIVNTEVHRRLGGHHSAKIVLVSVDFAEIEALQRQNRWQEAGECMAQAARQVEQGGADFLVLCTNTMHISTAAIEAAVRIPFLHIADATAQQIQSQGLATVGLLGTRFTMEEDFYKARLEQRSGLSVLIPAQAERDQVHRIIYDELVHGKIIESSRQVYRQAIQSLVDRGAQGIIFGCTEIGMLVSQADSAVPVFDTTQIHALAAVSFALNSI
jgi:aspartate racemase